MQYDNEIHAAASGRLGQVVADGAYRFFVLVFDVSEEVRPLKTLKRHSALDMLPLGSRLVVVKTGH